MLSPGFSDDDYRNSKYPDKEIIEPLRARAVMAQPIVFLAVAGQVMDGLATWIGIDGFPGLGEKHVVSQRVIDAGVWVNEKAGITHGLLDEGVWLFAIVKVALAGMIYYVFYNLNFESREAPSGYSLASLCSWLEWLWTQGCGQANARSITVPTEASRPFIEVSPALSVSEGHGEAA